MLGNALLTLYRSLTRHRLYAALNIMGLAVGIAVFLVLTLYVRFETGFERWIPQASKIYLVRETWKFPGMTGLPDDSTMGDLLPELQGDYSGLVGVRQDDSGVVVRQGDRSTADRAAFVGPGFFKLFDLPLVEGDKASALADPSNLVISQSVARKYFGAASPMGQTLTLMLKGVTHSYRITGVLKDLPKASDLKLDMVAQFVPAWLDTDKNFSHWGSSSVATYLKFQTSAEAAAFNAQMPGFIDRHGASSLGPDAHVHYALHATPLTSIHLSQPADAQTVATLGIVGVLTLLIAAVNYVNLATARAGLRAREVAVRKVVGGTRAALAAQFLAEALATAAAAALIALALVELTLPLVNAAGGTTLKLDYLGPTSVLPVLALTIVLIGFGAGAYPALVLSRFRPAPVLASARAPGGGRAGSRVREALVIGQFAIATAFMVSTGVLFAQTRYVQTVDPGFLRSGVIELTDFKDMSLSEAQRNALLDAARGLPGVVSVTQSDAAPGYDDVSNGTDMARPGWTGQWPVLRYSAVGPDFFRTYGLRLVAGRPLDRAHALDDVPAGSKFNFIDPSAQRNVVLNARAVKILRFASPAAALGQPMLVKSEHDQNAPLNVIGVVTDARFHSPRDPIAPTVYIFTSHPIQYSVAGVRFSGADPQRVTAELQGLWRGIAPGVPFEAKTVEQQLSPYYQSDQQSARLFTLGAALAVVIGCVGLYGMAAFNAARRVKEIGIRKTLGASTADILRLLVGQFLRPVLIANLIAWPLAWLAMRTWLAGFDQRIALGPQYFIAATALALLIAGLTVVGQALRVARAEPARALRYE